MMYSRRLADLKFRMKYNTKSKAIHTAYRMKVYWGEPYRVSPSGTCAIPSKAMPLPIH
jgi:hypothetical protein